jgi:serine/threonine-protein kinase
LEPPYLVMELVRGHSLHEVILDHSEALFAEIVACIGVVVCTALAEAHRAGIVHRDVKPGNIMVTASGRLALADFGVARIEDDDASLVTRTGALVGTPAFMSPEQAVGGDVDARSDIYSLGATLYRLATGMAPFSGPTARVVASIARGEHKSPLRRNPTMGVDLARIIERMMARDAGARYADCQAAAKALGEVVAAAGLGQPEKELAAFFADPVAYRAAYEPRVIRATLEQARRAARNRDATRAMALADRVVAMAPGEAEADEAMALVTSLGRSRTRVRIAAGALVAAVAIAAGVAAFADWGAVPTRGSETGDAALPDGGRDGMPGQVAVAVLAAGPVDAGRADARGHGDTIPAEVSKPVRDGSGKRPPDRPIHRPLYRPESGAARVADASVAAVDAATAAATAAAAPIVVAARPDAALARAGVKLDIRPWCDVRIGGDDYGRARRDRVISLLPGKHEIVCSQGPGRAEWRATVTLAPGEQKQLSGSVLRPVTITVAVTAGDRVVIDGRGYQNGVRLTLPPGRYRMDIKSGKRTVQGAWVAVPAVAACTVRDRPALDCYP